MKRGGYSKPRRKADMLVYYIDGLSALTEWCEDMEKQSPDWTLDYLDQRAQSLDRVLNRLGLSE